MSIAIDVIPVELVDGTKVLVPNSLEEITSYVLQEQRDWFEDEIKFLRSLVQPGDKVVDIGANYGVYALSLARKVGIKGQVWAFEPASPTAELLRESASANCAPWLQVVQKALSDREGTAWLQMPGQSELNSLAHPSSNEAATQKGSGESVAVTTLDQCLDTYGWTEISLLKIDAEGEEERILKGGKRFFHELSPLVMFEVKAGTKLNLDLVTRFQDLGYQAFQLVPGLDILAPFDADQQVDCFLLNLFAAKPDRIAALVKDGRLVEDSYPIIDQLDKSIIMNSWLQQLKEKPYAQWVSKYWQLDEQQPDKVLLYRALQAWVWSQDQDQSISSRYSALIHSLSLMKQACQLGANPSRWACLARVAMACGERNLALEALNVIVGEIHNTIALDLTEPFLSPDPAYEESSPAEHIDFWLEAACLSAIEKLSSFSSFYTGCDAIARLERIIEIGYSEDVVHRRRDMILKRYANQDHQMSSSEQSLRAWFDFLGLEKPLRCLDVGALSLQGEIEPWVRWAKVGCAEVIGFEPLNDKCDELNHQSKDKSCSIQYLPWAIGDGKEHILHITNVPMTSSLFPPARSTIDLFPGLGELMQVVQEVTIQTYRLDDIHEANGADFLKLDVQGAELMILENAQEALRSVSLIQCEVEFIELYEGQPLMADIDEFLRSHGFCFHRFAYTSERPFKPWQINSNAKSGMNQLLWGDAIYIRDFRNVSNWTNRHLQAAVFMLHEAFGSYDSAHFLLQELDRRCGSDLATCYVSALALIPTQ
jgi:FkbM family methyltransferase